MRHCGYYVIPMLGWDVFLGLGGLVFILLGSARLAFRPDDHCYQYCGTCIDHYIAYFLLIVLTVCMTKYIKLYTQILSITLSLT